MGKCVKLKEMVYKENLTYMHKRVKTFNYIDKCVFLMGLWKYIEARIRSEYECMGVKSDDYVERIAAEYPEHADIMFTVENVAKEIYDNMFMQGCAHIVETLFKDEKLKSLVKSLGLTVND